MTRHCRSIVKADDIVSQRTNLTKGDLKNHHMLTAMVNKQKCLDSYEDMALTSTDDPTRADTTGV